MRLLCGLAELRWQYAGSGRANREMSQDWESARSVSELDRNWWGSDDSKRRNQHVRGQEGPEEILVDLAVDRSKRGRVGPGRHDGAAEEVHIAIASADSRTD